jgi:hypothetical protein
VSRRLASELRRRPASRDPSKRFFLFCEGTKTEPAYFKALRQLYPRALIEIQIAPEAGVPYTLAKLAAAKARQMRKRGKGSGDSFEENDEVWAVFDRDEHPNHAEAVELCARAGVSVARSNPCFEVWLILHQADYDKPDDRNGAQARLRALCPEYEPTAGKTPDCGELITRIAAAETRAEKQLARRDAEGQPFAAPSTTVFQLTRAVSEAAERASLWHPGRHAD